MEQQPVFSIPCPSTAIIAIVRGARSPSVAVIQPMYDLRVFWQAKASTRLVLVLAGGTAATEAQPNSPATTRRPAELRDFIEQRDRSAERTGSSPSKHFNAAVLRRSPNAAGALAMSDSGSSAGPE
jgi:hypothetical protein